MVQWSTLRMLFTLALTLGLKTCQVNYSNVFVQADIDEEVYCNLPLEFFRSSTDDYALELKKSPHGLKQAPRLWFKTLEKNFDLSEEGTVEAFLGVEISDLNKGKLARQTFLIQRVIQAVGMEDSNPTKTLSNMIALSADDGGPVRVKTCNYASVVDMLMHLAGNTWPDIAFAVHQCAWFSHRPKKCHEDAVKRIVRHLKGTYEKGLIFKPTGELTLEAFADADFAGLWGVEEPQDATCVKLWTGYVIRLGGSPLIWKSKLQTLAAVSTMEAEYVALSACMRELIPLRCLLLELQSVFSFKISVARMACTVFEDNQGAIALANVLTMTPRSKHIAIPYHFFRENVRRKEIDVVHVVTNDQLMDMLTKGLVQVKFEKLRKMLMGW